MSGYVHVCAQCRRELVVPERLLGRDLRCTGCGTTFTAAIPAGEALPPPSPAAAGTGRRPWLVVGALAAALAVAVAALTLLSGGGPPEESPFGRSLTLGDGSQPSHFAAFERTTLIELGSLLARPEGAGASRVQQLLDGYRIIEVPSGTRVQVLPGGTPDGPIRVRLLTGRWAEKEVWVQASWVR